MHTKGGPADRPSLAQSLGYGTFGFQYSIRVWESTEWQTRTAEAGRAAQTPCSGGRALRFPRLDTPRNGHDEVTVFGLNVDGPASSVCALCFTRRESETTARGPMALALDHPLGRSRVRAPKMRMRFCRPTAL